MSFSVQDKVALVTGANRGIGKSIVEALLNNGASKVYAAVRNPASAADLARASGGRVVAVELDLARPATIAAAAGTAKDVQLVVNNAGVLKSAGPLDGGAIDALQFEIDVNVFGLIRMAQAFGPVLAANGGGAFVQLNSVVSLRSFANFATYSASKAAAYSITQALRDQWKERGILVVSVHPGPIATDMADAAGIAAVAEPATLVADGIVASLAAGEFHVFPGTMARKFWSAYQGFAGAIVETEASEG